MALDFVDRYSSTVNSSYTAGGTSLVVASATGLPNGASDYYIIVQAEGGNTEEVFHVTSRSGTTLTVAGAQAGTSASNHGVGAVVIGSIMTKDAFTQFKTDAGGSGGLTLLEQHTASSSASLDFTTCITSAYDDYLIEAVNLLPATNAVDVWLRVSTDGGSSYDSGSNYAYGRFVLYTTTAYGTSASDTKIPLSPSDTMSNASTGGFNMSLHMYDPLNSSAYKRFVGQSNGYDNAGPGERAAHLFGVYKSATAVNAFQIIMSSGNIASGIVRVYGFKK